MVQPDKKHHNGHASRNDRVVAARSYEAQPADDKRDRQTKRYRIFTVERKRDAQNKKPRILSFILGMKKYVEVIEPEWLKSALYDYSFFLSEKYKPKSSK